MAELKFEIKEYIGTVSESSKGLTFTNEELKNLRDILIDMNL